METQKINKRYVNSKWVVEYEFRISYKSCEPNVGFFHFFVLPFLVWFWSFLYDFLFVVQYLFSFCQRLRHLFLRPPSFSNLDDWWEFHHCWTTMAETHQKRSLHPPYCHQFLIRCQVFRLKKEQDKNRENVLFLQVFKLNFDFWIID